MHSLRRRGGWCPVVGWVDLRHSVFRCWKSAVVGVFWVRGCKRLVKRGLVFLSVFKFKSVKSVVFGFVSSVRAGETTLRVVVFQVIFRTGDSLERVGI